MESHLCSKYGTENVTSSTLLRENERMVHMAPDGGGNYICFDYRNCKENPSIVYWDHSVEEHEGIFFLANSFEEFINSLKSEDEIGELLKE